MTGSSKTQTLSPAELVDGIAVQGLQPVKNNVISTSGTNKETPTEYESHLIADPEVNQTGGARRSRARRSRAKRSRGKRSRARRSRARRSRAKRSRGKRSRAKRSRARHSR